ncbi:MAG TPA: class I SAM-dependent methyltransferase [Candidatus Saccharimonadales bacterium]|nr:class I SAM-dependent methyltransferase [Candidatus Saccharimonadales bacterium]
MGSSAATAIQREYYARTAERYSTMHASESSDDPKLREFLVSALRPLGIRSWLDVGSANGRGLPDLADALPGAFVCGAEPVTALVQQGITAGFTKKVSLMQASGEALPFANGSFDVVSEFSVLHHAANPTLVVKEMTRVARKAVVVVDSNRFGQGSMASRWLKLAVYKLGLWGAFNYLRTGGKRYQISEGDGLFYSYSVFDSFQVLAGWADRLVVYTNRPSPKSWFHPILTSAGVTLIALRDTGGE